MRLKIILLSGKFFCVGCDLLHITEKFLKFASTLM